MRKCLNVLAVCLICSIGVTSPVYAEKIPDLPPVLISELQLGGLTAAGDVNGRQEFMELYNPGELAMDITGWRLEYLSASHLGMGVLTRQIVELQGLLLPYGFALVGPADIEAVDISWPSTLSASGHLAQGGGHVRLVTDSGVLIDLITWGSAAAISDWPKLAAIPAGQSVQRILPHEADFTNGKHFRSPAQPSPDGGDLQVITKPPKECELWLSEIMPNPAGVDAGKEYIEVYNPTDMAQPLEACSLKIGEATKVIPLPTALVEPKGFWLLGDDLGFSLPNSNAVTVWLMGSTDKEGVAYANALPDDHVWWLREGMWEENPYGTPGTINKRSPEAPPDTPPSVHEPEECPPGKERNPETNRCRSTEPTLLPCKPMQVRNIDTGRCRNVVADNPTSIPCKAGQERNPETNRCRAILAAVDGPKPCPEGQVRSTETNRCRKQESTPVKLATVEDVTSNSQSSIRWAIIGVAVAAVGGYAIYEWRHDLLNVIHRWRMKLTRRFK